MTGDKDCEQRTRGSHEETTTKMFTGMILTTSKTLIISGGNTGVERPSKLWETSE